MISLLELMHTVDKSEEGSLIPIDKWNWTEVDHLATMEFKFDGEYYMRLKAPEMAIYKKKEGDEEPFYLVEFKKKDEKKTPILHKFRNFHQLMTFFDTYEQPDVPKTL